MTAMWQVIFYTGFAVIAFYFFLLRPVLQEQKSRRKAVRQLQVGDEIVTTGGLIGEVKDVVVPVDGPTELILEIAPGVRVRALTDAVARRLSTLEPEETPASPTEAAPGEVSHTSA
ncbi:MAG: preprotein translocase subunit YajC [Dehalococcoidia bacterium]|nr:preprotein translocase subunit YajC [Dehalococcoidia bacterium]